MDGKQLKTVEGMGPLLGKKRTLSRPRSTHRAQNRWRLLTNGQRASVSWDPRGGESGPSMPLAFAS